MKQADSRKKITRILYNYLLFFLLVAFLVSCCTILFVTILRDNLNIQLTSENLNMAAKLTFGNVIILSFLFTLIDYIRRKFTTERTTKHIAKAAQKVTHSMPRTPRMFMVSSSEEEPDRPALYFLPASSETLVMPLSELTTKR